MPESLKNPIFGIIGGAGPLSSLTLNKQLIRLCQKNGGWKDLDFPEIRLISFPFSEMLEGEVDSSIVQLELAECLLELEKTCDYIVIACNTLHLFLPERPLPKLIHLIKLIKKQIPEGTIPLILATHTSAQANLHGRLFDLPCEYWNPEQSQNTINAILRGESPNLDWIGELAKTRLVILGCTEYSLALENAPPHVNIIDPLQLAAQFLFTLHKRFSKNEH